MTNTGAHDIERMANAWHLREREPRPPKAKAEHRCAKRPLGQQLWGLLPLCCHALLCPQHRPRRLPSWFSARLSSCHLKLCTLRLGPWTHGCRVGDSACEAVLRPFCSAPRMPLCTDTPHVSSLMVSWELKIL